MRDTYHRKREREKMERDRTSERASERVNVRANKREHSRERERERARAGGGGGGGLKIEKAAGSKMERSNKMLYAYRPPRLSPGSADLS